MTKEEKIQKFLSLVDGESNFLKEFDELEKAILKQSNKL